MELSEIKGIGEKRLQKLNSVGIYNPIDLLSHFPYKYINTEVEFDINNVNDGEEVVFLGTVAANPISKFIRRGLSFVKVKFEIAGGELVGCTWFNQNYISKQLQIGKQFYVVGKVKKFKNSFDISSPTLSCYRENSNKIIPLYRNIKVPQNIFAEAIKTIFTSVSINSYLPEYLTIKYDLMKLNNAFYELHYPSSLENIELSRHTIAMENLSFMLSVFSIIKCSSDGNRVFWYSDNRVQIKTVMKSLPFELTADQLKAIEEIITSLHSNRQMNRLLQGDVGCGKTIVAFLAMYYAFLSGFQSVLMAPTELLARQHYSNAVKLFSPLGVEIEYLSSSQSKTERDNALFNIKNGVVNFIIGTHSLIQESVVFKNLALTITDEQHRFGVNQRGNLENKSVGTDCIVMSATPIPRTLALTLYGELEQSQIKMLPKGKAEIITKFVPSRKLDDMYKYILENTKRGEQAYIVCPRIDDDEENDLKSVKEIYENLKNTVFKEIKIGLLHGQMKDNEKNSVMAQFSKGEISVLVATTVIEVGIDVAAATSIIIFNAERYGLSQLHQLRGRVGRGDKKSYCFLMTDSDNEQTVKRLEYMIKCSNGFELAEYDFQMRGAGDFIGTRQHGNSAVIQQKITAELINAARDISNVLLEDRETYLRLSESIAENSLEYIKSITLN